MNLKDLHHVTSNSLQNRRRDRRVTDRRRMIVFVEHDRRRGEDRRTGIDRRRIGRWPRLPVTVAEPAES